MTCEWIQNTPLLWYSARFTRTFRDHGWLGQGWTPNLGSTFYPNYGIMTLGLLVRLFPHVAKTIIYRLVNWTLKIEGWSTYLKRSQHERVLTVSESQPFMTHADNASILFHKTFLYHHNKFHSFMLLLAYTKLCFVLSPKKILRFLYSLICLRHHYSLRKVKKIECIGKEDISRKFLYIYHKH